MTIYWLAFILGSLVAVFLAFLWVAVKVGSLQGGGGKGKKGGNKSVGDLDKAYDAVAEEDVNHLFNKEFREELRNRGRLRFEKVVDENAMFLKQDLDLTIGQLNEYMKQELSSKLDSEFADYAKALKEAQELTLNSLQKTAASAEEQGKALENALREHVAAREDNMMKVFGANMAEVVEHYLVEALGTQFDVKSQLPMIVHEMEANKQQMSEDMRL
jgi:hypothetical protein